MVSQWTSTWILGRVMGYSGFVHFPLVAKATWDLWSPESIFCRKVGSMYVERHATDMRTFPSQQLGKVC